MLERYLEQQAAIFSAHKNIRDIVTLSDDDVKVAEEILQAFKPLKVVTTLLSAESAPPVSMVLPLNKDSKIHGPKWGRPSAEMSKLLLKRTWAQDKLIPPHPHLTIYIDCIGPKIIRY